MFGGWLLTPWIHIFLSSFPNFPCFSLNHNYGAWHVARALKGLLPAALQVLAECQNVTFICYTKHDEMALQKPVEWLVHSCLWILKTFLISVCKWSKCPMKVITRLFNIFEKQRSLWGHGIFKALFWNVQRNSMCFLMKCIWKSSISISSCAFPMSWIATLLY